MGEPYTALKAIEALLTQEEVYVKAALTLLEPKPVPREEIIKLQLKIVEDWLEKAKTSTITSRHGKQLRDYGRR